MEKNMENTWKIKWKPDFYSDLWGQRMWATLKSQSVKGRMITGGCRCQDPLTTVFLRVLHLIFEPGDRGI